MAKCTRCGERLPRSAHFCPVCGLAAEPEEQETATVAQVEETQSEVEAQEETAPDDVVEAEPLEEPSFNLKYVRNIAMFCHIAAFAGLSAPLVGNILAPFVLWRLKRRDDPFIDYNGKQAINFQISMSLYALVLLLISIAVPPFSIVSFVLVAIWVFGIIRASIRTNRGIEFRYPLSFRFMK